MSIYKDQKSTFGSVTFPTAFNLAAEQELLESMQQFLYYLDGNSATVPNSSFGFPSYTSSLTSNQMKNLYNNAFNPSGSSTPDIQVTGASMGTYALVVSPTTPINAGCLTAGLHMVVLFHLTKQLQLISHGTYDRGYSSWLSKDDTKITEWANTNLSAMPLIYKNMREVLLVNGFRTPSTGGGSGSSSEGRRILFNKLFHPNLVFLDENNHLNINTITGNLLTYIKGSSTIIDRNTRIKNGYGDDSDSNQVDLIQNVIDDWNIAKKEVSQFYVKGLYENILSLLSIPLPFDGYPKVSFMASGNGSQTKGVLDFTNYGILMFEYDPVIKISPSAKRVIPKTTRTVSLPVTPGVQSIMNLSVFGVNSAALVNVMIDGIRCYFVASNQPNRSLDNPPYYYNGNITPNDSVLTPCNSPIPSSEFVLLKTDLAATNPIASINTLSTDTYDFISPTTGLVIASYNKSTQELRFVSAFSSVGISVSGVKDAISIGSDLLLGEDEDIACQVSVVKEPIEFFDFSIENLFENDRFELTNEKKDSFLAMIPEIDTHLQKIADLLVSNPALVPTVTLNGAFIGKLLLPTPSTGQKVVADTAYTIFRSSTLKRELQTVPENTPTINYEERYSQLRYSYGRVYYSKDVITIQITSYVSPLRSRLDKRLLGPHLDGTGTPDTDLFDYRSYDNLDASNPEPYSNLNRFNTILQPHTLFGANPSGDAYLLEQDDTAPVSSSNFKFSSYNQLLSALRCFGILEALTVNIQKKNSTSTALQTKLQDLINSAQCNTIRSGGLSTGSYLYITNAEYEGLKWYTSAEDKEQY